MAIPDKYEKCSGKHRWGRAHLTKVIVPSCSKKAENSVEIIHDEVLSHKSCRLLLWGKKWKTIRKANMMGVYFHSLNLIKKVSNTDFFQGVFQKFLERLSRKVLSQWCLRNSSKNSANDPFNFPSSSSFHKLLLHV